jgi:hypothetical protein
MLFLISQSRSRAKHYSKPQIALFGLVVFMLMLSTVTLALITEYTLVQLPTVGYNPPNILLLLQDLKTAGRFLSHSNVSVIKP